MTGCHAPQANGPTETVLHIADREVFLDRTLTLLRENDFRPQQVDRAEGLAIAGPTTSGQWFEFWRPDHQGAYQDVEASLHTVRRTVIVQMTPAALTTQAASQPDSPRLADDGMYRVNVTVEKARYSAPERQMTTAVGVLGIYSSRLPTEEGLRNARTTGEHWVPIGRDPLLEQWFLERITPLASATSPAEAIPPAPDSQPASSSPAASMAR